jgi:hypothetical protein
MPPFRMAISDWYHREIVEPGKQPLLFVFIGLLGAFLFIRFSVRMIRSEVSWWPKNVESSGGLHIHHVVFGIVFMIISGFGLASPAGSDRPWGEILGALFGIGTALVLDEFALVLHLEDVYWSEEGRLSVDSVVLGVAVCGLLLVGAAPFGADSASTEGEPASGWSFAVTILFNACFAVVCLTKGKAFTGLIGILVPFFALIGAIRLARPGSPWARRFYKEGSHKEKRALAREEREGWRRSLRIKVYNAIAGRPSEPAPPAAPPD